MPVVQRPLPEGHRHVEGTVGAVNQQFRHLSQKVIGNVAGGLIQCDPLLEVDLVAGVLHDGRYHHLGQGGGADLVHLGGQDQVDVLAELIIVLAVIDLDPAAARTGPGELLGYSLERDGRHITDYVADRYGALAVVDDVVVDLVADDEQAELFGDSHDLLKDLFAVHHAGGVVRVDDHDGADARVVDDLAAQFLKVRFPAVCGVEPEMQRRCLGMAHFTKGVGGVGGRWHQYPCLGLQATVDLGNGVPQPVEEDDIVRSDLSAVALVGGLTDKLAGFQDAAGVAIAPAVIVHYGLGHDLFHPVRDLLSLDDRVTDVFPVDGDTAFLKFFRYVDNVADLVGQLSAAGLYQVNTHAVRFLSAFKVVDLKQKQPQAACLRLFGLRKNDDQQAAARPAA